MFTYGDQKIAVVTDSSCDLSPEQLAAYDVRLIPLRVVCSRGEFRDRLEISQEEIYELLENELPKSSLPLPGDVSEMYAGLYAQGCTQVLHLSMSSGLSGTYNMVRLVASEFENKMDIRVIDSRTLSCGLGLMVLEACEVLAQGGSLEEAAARAERVRESQLGCFVIRTLEYLRKGGRIGLVEGVVGTILQLKPVIFVNTDGVYQTLAKARGYAGALDAMLKEFASRFGQKKVRITVVHARAYEDAQKLLEKVKGMMNVTDNYFISSISPVLSIHTGPGLVGLIAQEVL